MKHTPVILARAAGCTCKRWNGPARLSNENQGSYTLRAFAAHSLHAADAIQAEQGDLFVLQNPLIFTGGCPRNEECGMTLPEGLNHA